MDQQLIETTPFPILNEYCLLEIIKSLDMIDYINFINTSDYLIEISKMWTHWKFSKIFIDAEWMSMLYTQRTFLIIGRHIKEMVIDFDGIDEGNVGKILKSVSDHCIGLKRLCIRNHKSIKKCKNLAFSNVETLSLTWCNWNFLRECLRSFGNLKSLNFHDCDKRGMLTVVEWTILFQSNQNIESINLPNAFNGGELLALLPSLEKLSGCHSIDETKTSVELNSLLRCNRITKLRLLCDENEVLPDFLYGLCNGGNVEELALTYLGVFNSQMFDALKSSVKMEVLVLWLDGTSLPPLIWPTNLKKFKLQNCCITLIDFVAIIKQLKQLEKLDLLQCKIVDQHGTPFNNPVELSRLLSNAYKKSGNQQMLNVRLPYCYYKALESLPSNEHPPKKTINASVKIVDKIEPMEIESNTGFDIIRLKQRK